VRSKAGRFVEGLHLVGGIYQCCICRVGESVGEDPEEIISATLAENVGICRQDLKKIQKQSFFSIFSIFLNL
jgi:hypothetical protein